MRRSCLHCALARALRAESATLGRQGRTVVLSCPAPVALPQPGGPLFRQLRLLLRAAAGLATDDPIKLTVVDLVGKSHVEVTATVRACDGVRVLVRAFPRHAEGTLAGGFAETLV